MRRPADLYAQVIDPVIVSAHDHGLLQLNEVTQRRLEDLRSKASYQNALELARRMLPSASVAFCVPCREVEHVFRDSGKGVLFCEICGVAR